MDAIKGNMFAILNGYKQFVIPVYQRIYSWEREQCQRLWQDIVAMQKENKAGHFVGSIVNIAEQAMPTGVQKFMIIDGQQRMTTLTLFLIALRDYADAHQDDQTINAPMITSLCLKNDFQSGYDRYKMLLTEADRDVLIDLIEKKPITNKKPSRIIENYNFFVEKVTSGVLKPAAIYESIGKLQIVNITLDRQVDDPQAIFESLNSTGMDLSESDLIRNYILMGLDNDEQIYVYENIWRPTELLFDYERQSALMDRFFRDYLTMKLGHIPKINHVYEEFKQYHLNSKFNSVGDLCQDIYTFSKYYTDMCFCRSSEPALKACYSEIQALRSEVVYPFLLRVHKDWEKGSITLDELIEIIKMCINYVLRRAVCNIPTNSLNKTFATLKNFINPSDYLNSIKAAFVLMESYKEFPTDEKFVSILTTRDVYNMRIRNYILSKLENFQNKASITIENYTIEHIMPQNPNLSREWISDLGHDWQKVQRTYLHTLGNLTLTAYNAEMGDYSFTEKLNMEGGFKQSALRINSYVVLQDTWNAEKIQERAKELGTKALRIWPYPSITEEKMAPYKKNQNAKPEYTLNSYEHLNQFTRMLFEKLDLRIMNLSPDVHKEFKKMYVAYKLDTNFVDIVIHKERLCLSVNMPFEDVIDPKGICRDVSELGRWANGDVEVFFDSLGQLDDVMAIVDQAYHIQAD